MASRTPILSLIALLALLPACAACATVVVTEDAASTGSGGGAASAVSATTGAGASDPGPPPCQEDACAPPGFVFIPPGSFTMGAPWAESQKVPSALDEQPPHPITISRGFFLLSSEVTQGKWSDVMGTNPSQNAACGFSCPVENVSFWDALAFANALSASTGSPACYDLDACTGVPGVDFTCPDTISFDLACHGYRLPTEAEWEYAARAGLATPFYNGESFLSDTGPDSGCDDIAWYAGNTSGTMPVGEKLKSPWGLYDTSGNVYEWVWDRYGAGYYKSAPTIDPQGPAKGASRGMRGGSYLEGCDSQRSANRDVMAPDQRGPMLGFRVARGL
jgi:formylglycine-generating enzyme required for sulfatase activity